MTGSDVCDHAGVRSCDLCKSGHLAEITDSHFQDCNFIFITQSENCKRKSKFIVKVSLCFQSAVFLAEYRSDHFLGAGLTYTSGNPNYRNLKLLQIEFRNVSFAYTDHQNDELVYVLKDINLVIPKGKTIALVGQSGSGKSTMLDLIPRYYDVQEGEVLIDGINVKDLAVHDLRQLIGNVNQEAILFNASFKDNIRFGKTDATDEDIANAAKIANAYEFITKSEHGFDTGIGDRGGRLSGGQRQRVSIARAILKNPPILILDEATSALDTESERLVQDALEKLMKTRTTVAVAHRLSTIKHADEICVMHEGRIVERGTHDELIGKDGYYKKLHDMQQV